MIALLAALLALLGAPTLLDEAGVEEWFDTTGIDVARSGAVSALPDLSNAQRDELSLSEPFPVGRVTDDGLVEPTAQSNLWMAIVLLEGEPQATLLVNFATEDEETLMESDEFLVSTASALGGPDALYFDEDLIAYFSLIDGEIGPASERALDYLAGTVTPDQFRAIRSDLVIAGVPTTPALVTDEESGINPVVIVLILLALTLVLVTVVTWYRASGETEEGTRSVDNDVERIRRKVRFYRRGDPNVNVGD